MFQDKARMACVQENFHPFGQSSFSPLQSCKTCLVFVPMEQQNSDSVLGPNFDLLLPGRILFYPILGRIWVDYEAGDEGRPILWPKDQATNFGPNWDTDPILG